MRDLDWLTPYYIKSSGVWPWRNHAVMFEDTNVVICTRDHELASLVVGGLNGAYNLGRSSMALEMEFETRRAA